MERFPVENVNNEIEDSDVLSQEQIEYLLGLLNNSDIDESDAELALVLLRDHGDDVLQHMESLLVKFPASFALFISSALTLRTNQNSVVVCFASCGASTSLRNTNCSGSQRC
jgi:hypothetical protein